MELLAVYWEWKEGTPHAGARFWALHNVSTLSEPTADGRLRDWPKEGFRALGAAKVTVIEGEGLDLIPPASAV
jgi:hypothetical protein